MVNVKSNVLAVGIANKAEALLQLPVRLFVMYTGAEAVRCLREEEVDMVISRWELDDMPGGILLQRIIAAKSGMPTIALIRSHDNKNEAAARCLGVSVVLSEDIDDEHFIETVCHLLRVCAVTPAKVNRWLKCGIR